MSSVTKAPKSPMVLRMCGTAAGFVLFLSQFGPAAADPGAASPSWGAKLESEAEFAYRSVYQRSLATQKKRQAVRRKIAKRKPLTTAAIPELPTRKEIPATEPAPTAESVKAEQEASPPPAAPPKLATTEDFADEPPAETLLAPLIGRPRSLADIITTQGIEDENDATARPGRVPRGRGDQYCANIANAANDARFVWQKQELLQTEEEVKKRIAALENKIAEYRKWLNRRDEFSQKARTAITSIYAKMRPDAAAQQLTLLDEETAAALISKLNPRVASAVMAEMDAKDAARLTFILSASSKGPKGKPPEKAEAGGT